MRNIQGNWLECLQLSTRWLCALAVPLWARPQQAEHDDRVYNTKLVEMRPRDSFLPLSPCCRTLPTMDCSPSPWPRNHSNDSQVWTEMTPGELSTAHRLGALHKTRSGTHHFPRCYSDFNNRSSQMYSCWLRQNLFLSQLFSAHDADLSTCYAITSSTAELWYRYVAKRRQTHLLFLSSSSAQKRPLDLVSTFCLALPPMHHHLKPSLSCMKHSSCNANKTSNKPMTLVS